MRLINFLIRRRNRVYSIKRFEDNASSVSPQSLVERLKEVDSQIQITSQAILEAQLVKLRSVFFKSNSILDGFQKRIVESSVNTSVQWHQNHLRELREEKVKLQLHFDQLTGRAWQRKSIKLIRLFLMLIVVLISSLFFIMGIFTVIYLLPFFTVLILAFLIIKTIKNSEN